MNNYIEIIGVLASILVLISFAMKNERSIRKINILGAVTFVIYGLTINAFSIWVLNLILILIHLYRLKNMK